MLSHNVPNAANVRIWVREWPWDGDSGRNWGSGLALFLSTFVNRIDRKGRVSVPAPFRTVLAPQTFPGVIAFPSFVVSAIEASGIDRIERLSAGIDQFDPFSDEHDAFAISILADSHQLSFDSEGRIMLPEVLREHAGITEQAAFVGRGATFQVWEPDAFRGYQEDARKRAREERGNLRLDGGTGGAPAA